MRNFTTYIRLPDIMKVIEVKEDGMGAACNLYGRDDK